MSSRTRFVTACITCRTQKQKCDEAKPACSRCRRLKRPCTYPEYRKRSGPTKGYVEAIEHRLRETEGALLRLWMATDDESLKRAFQGDMELPHLRAASSSAAAAASDASVSEKTSLISLWEDFPLTSAKGVDAWACRTRGLRKAADNATTGRLDSVSTSAQEDAAQTLSGMSSGQLGAPLPVSSMAAASTPTREASASRSRRRDQSRGRRAIRRAGSSSDFLPFQPQQSSGDPGTSSATPRRNEAEAGAIDLAPEFQQQFLW